MYWKGRQSDNVVVAPTPGEAAAAAYLRRYVKLGDATQNRVERQTERDIDESQDMARPEKTTKEIGAPKGGR